MTPASLPLQLPFTACRVDLKPWPFWSKKVFESVDVGDRTFSGTFATPNSPVEVYPSESDAAGISYSYRGGVA
ncbi:hypothetical protein MA16_Dca018448 [Dendrobium catenatum]|uniref:Uncharacterized protein n=1 Tax=Dendrobium catenatum TaxID=906689 RepID=A0A2I0XF86_9ASPA|nr:hypothetical protein MA16_Dca018448 [Dendrobium catenatum]